MNKLKLFLKGLYTYSTYFHVCEIIRLFDLRQMNVTTYVLQNNDTYLQNYTEEDMILF